MLKFLEWFIIMKNELNLNSHETLKIGIILSLVGGILDAHTFLFRNGVFANTQTGNIVFLALYVNTERTQKTMQCIFSIIAFIIGILLTEFIKKKIKNKHRFNYICLILVIEIFFITLISLIPKNINNMLVIVTVAFVCSLQTNAFRTLQGSPYSTTMCTGNLRSACSSLFFFIYNKDKKDGKICLRYYVIIAMFFLGALIGRFLTTYIEEKTLLVCSALLTIALFILIISLSKKFKKTPADEKSFNKIE